MSFTRILTPLAACAVFGALLAQTASAATLHPDVVIENPANYTPSLVATTAVPTPRVDELGRLGNTIYAGGIFERVSQNAVTYARSNFVAFNAASGALSAIDPNFDDQVWAIEAVGNSIFVGGEFTRVDGILRRRLVKLNATTGEVDMAFNARFSGGIVRDLKIWNGPGNQQMLVVGGSMPGQLLALDPNTGANLGYFNLGISDAIPGAWGKLAVFQFAINPQGTKLVATGNFTNVSGQLRKHLFVADLTDPNAAQLDPWYYPGFAKRCWSVNIRRVAYLQGVDFSPDGEHFVVAATGFVTYVPEDIWPDGASEHHTVCDAAARFNINNDDEPVWINYSGGDSLFAIADTGAAVYVQGHSRWLDNPWGRDSMGPGAVVRPGIGAIDPVTGKALPWDPRKPAQVGGKAFLVTEEGLWVGSDSRNFSGEPRRGIGFVPLP